ncbi:MAG: alpha/beta fold hydrolase [Bacteroidota bacterium]
MKLHSKISGSGRPMLIMHGLFGSGDNWYTVGNVLAKEGFEVHLLDLRNHGRSPHDPVFNYTVMAEDLQEYISGNSLMDPVLIGHSMGGKTVLKHAQKYPDEASARIIVDIAPRGFDVRHMDVVEALQSVDFNAHTTRKSVETVMREHLDDEGNVQFLLKNLYWKTDQQLAWRFALDFIVASIHEVGARIDFECSSEMSILFVRGALSDYVTDEDVVSIQHKCPQARFVNIHGAGHRVHIDKPQEFISSVLHFLANKKP